MRIPFLRSYTAFSSHQKPTHDHTTVSSSSDLEKNALHDTNPSTASNAPHPTHEYLSPPLDPSTFPPTLLKFQNLVGISVPPAIRSQQPQRPAQNLGIYKRTCDHEVELKLQYKVSAFLVNVCFLLQIVVGAALTALGAAGGPSAAVTVLGAVNTILAGLLTYLKGQGLPQRLEQHFNLLRTLREHIEARERDFSERDCELDVDAEVDAIVRMYKEVRQTAQDNAPGNVLPPRGNISALVKKTEGAGHESALPRGDGSAGGVKAVMAGLKDVKQKYDEQRYAAEGAGEKGKETVEKVELLKQGALERVEEERRKAGEEIEKLERGMKNL